MQTVSLYTELEYAFLFTLRKVNSINTAGFQPFFQNLPIDPYVKGEYRSRRLSRFRVSGDKLVKLPHGYLLQSKDYNPLLGGIKREFAELDHALIELEIFNNLIFAFYDSCKLHPEAEIDVHQIRTTCSVNNLGNPAPEGIHRDGSDFIGIFSAGRDNIQGGETHLYSAKKEKPVFNKVLQPGEIILVNEHQFLHFTTPIKPEIPGFGSRDVFVINSPSLMSDF
ncbi:2OG-Fe dioxygenase family protein [Dolichospermum sp. ST_sed1]|nr:2OG-Fe dioxygenase family protein [Dolichospermum sp. ST_sed1]MDD1427103.1 2OG-Fe dioxygenase family protein [Dolichospermum sp. ST_sed9]MDD1433851.1 2OG-Fe dioxygenase family protein [Dolichospermum sp. ST_sed6]MDD1436394.1 2OG-Fe dioxygenase family protein [Dolichospermum sp. ST_sed10]MDD1443755.1 2OG-Fe dioxygenase family protein [Dolichospermum sp. ST_sed3]MDD1449309.1 2OG-Fe dioxygenase family protein [Dolichospermum sp. ST_sed8]MDD1457702.1 2OG-Fe dioxygenase family protein [Dolichos